MAVCVLKTDRTKLLYQLKLFTLVRAVKILAPREDSLTLFNISRLYIKQFRTARARLATLPRRQNLSAISGPYHVIASRKAVRRLRPYELEYCKHFTRYKSHCLEILVQAELDSVISNMRVSEQSAEQTAFFKMKRQFADLAVYELDDVVLNGTDLLGVIEHAYNCTILFKGEVHGFKPAEGEIVTGKNTDSIEFSYEYNQPEWESEY